MCPFSHAAFERLNIPRIVTIHPTSFRKNEMSALRSTSEMDCWMCFAYSLLGDDESYEVNQHCTLVDTNCTDCLCFHLTLSKHNLSKPHFLPKLQATTYTNNHKPKTQHGGVAPPNKLRLFLVPLSLCLKLAVKLAPDPGVKP